MNDPANGTARVESASVPSSAANGKPAPSTAQRLLSLDTYRGLIMVTLAFNGFGLADTARRHWQAEKAAGEPASAAWQTVLYQFDHVEWAGCGYWDLIQPSFMFMVGVAMAYSYAKRRELGQSFPRMLAHAVWRSLVLIFLGIFLISNRAPATNWSLMNVLTQIGLGYTFLFLLWNTSQRTRAVAAAGILAGTWFLYVLFPHYMRIFDRPEQEYVPAYTAKVGVDLQKGDPTVGVSKKFAEEYLTGMDPAWHKNANVGHAIDIWILNELPQAQPFTYNRGGYQTINFIPSLATMLFGVMCGDLLRSSRSSRRKVLMLLLAGGAGLGVGYAMEFLGMCPLVKRIWTPSWALFSTGWCCLILASLFAVVDMAGQRWWTFPLVVVGMNSIAIYCMGQLLPGWVADTWKTHCGPNIFKGEFWSHPLWASPEATLFEPTVRACLVGLVFWLVCLWMYRQKIFVRI